MNITYASPLYPAKRETKTFDSKGHIATREQADEIRSQIPVVEEEIIEELKNYRPPADVFEYDGEYHYDIGPYIRNYMESYLSSVAPESSYADRYLTIIERHYAEYQGVAKAYQKVIQECDKDVAFCEDLVKNNTDPERTAIFEQLLENARNRRQDIKEQAAGSLAARVEHTRIMTRLNCLDVESAVYREGTKEEQEALQQIREKLSRIPGPFERGPRFDLLLSLDDPSAFFMGLDRSIAEFLGQLGCYGR